MLRLRHVRMLSSTPVLASKTGSYAIETLGVHAGQAPDPATGARSPPIYQSTSFVFHGTQHAAELFSLDEPGNIYSRISNPTNDVLEKRIALMEGGVGALATSSGSSALMTALLTIMDTGAHIVSSKTLYGGTHHLFADTLPKLGIETTMVDVDDKEQLQAAFRPNTKCLFAEVIGNPALNVADLEGLAAVARDNGVPLIVDSTFATPFLCRPLEHGADIVVHSATKWIGGHGTSIGGLIIDGGSFNWASEQFPGFTTPDPSYGDMVYARDWGTLAFIVKARAQFLRDAGPCISPFNSFLLLQGLETLHVRMERHCSNALKIAEFLSSHEAVEWVTYPGLPGHPTQRNVEKYLRDGAGGGVVVFGIKGGLTAGQKAIESVSLWSHLANVGDAKSLIIHPASTTHQQLSAADRKAGGVGDDLIRLSVGIENVDDLIADLDRALKTAFSGRLSTPTGYNDEGVLRTMCARTTISEGDASRPLVFGVVGLSDVEARPSYRVARKMQRMGYKIVPINPLKTGKTILGEKVYSSLDDVEDTIDVLQVFRSADAAPGLAREAVANADRIGLKVFWLQEGVVSEEAAEIAAGHPALSVVMNRCTYKECQRFMGPMATWA